MDRIRSMDDAFRQQLDVKEQQHSSEMQRVRLEAQQNVDVANKRVSAHQLRTLQLTANLHVAILIVTGARGGAGDAGIAE